MQQVEDMDEGQMSDEERMVLEAEIQRQQGYNRKAIRSIRFGEPHRTPTKKIQSKKTKDIAKKSRRINQKKG
jgi:hypothetical protein